MKNKRGQLTLFVILGIIVLIIVGVAIYLIGLNKNKIETDVFEENYDAKLAPIYNDVVFCINRLGKEAIIQAGATGGYPVLNPSDYTYNSPLSYNNDALELFPGSNIVIPYWFHIEDAPDCTECYISQSFPSLTGTNSIQENIEKYVEKNLVSCLDNFSAYKLNLDIKYSSEPDCTVELRDENVFFGVNWPIEVTFPDDTESKGLSKYSTTLDVRLKKMYEYALSVLYQTEMVEDQRAFEYFMKDILSFYSFGGQNSIIPPVAGPTVFEFEAPTIWMKNNVETNLKNAVAENIPYMQVVGTKDSFVLFTNDSIKNNFYANFQNVVYYDEDFSNDIRVRFNYYPMWPFYVNVGPSDGPVIMPESSTVNLMIMKLSTTKYRFYYDIAYPVLVTLEDDTAFDGEGYLFNYAFEANLRNNEVYSNSTIDMKSLMNQETEVEELGYTQRTVPVTINVIDGYTYLPLDGITVSYTCLDKEYVVGTSKSSQSNPNAIISSMLAPCVGGKFELNDFGYGESALYKDVVLDEPLIFDYYVYPARNITLDLKKRIFKPSTQDVDPSEMELDRYWNIAAGEGEYGALEEDEEISFIMSEVRSDGSVGNVAFLSYNSTSERIISLSPGTYSIDVISQVKLGSNYTRQNITIPGRTIKVKGDDVDIEPVVIDKAMYIGGISINEDNGGLFTVTPTMLTKSYFKVYYASFDPDDLRFVEDFSVLEKIMNARVNAPEQFIPVFE